MSRRYDVATKVDKRHIYYDEFMFSPEVLTRTDLK